MGSSTHTESSAYTFPIRDESVYLFRTQSGIFRHTSVKILVVSTDEQKQDQDPRPASRGLGLGLA